MSVYEAIRRKIRVGTILYTPSKTKRRATFEVESTDDPVTFRVGRTKGRMRVPKSCLNGIPDFLRGKGWVRSGSRHEEAIEGTLEDYLDRHKGKRGGSFASYVVPVLQEAGVIELQYGKHLEVKLSENFT